jgi:hypothetical protein
VRPDIEVGVCGEHGGDPESVAFFHRVGLDYVSCSPFRVPIARLAAAQAAAVALRLLGGVHDLQAVDVLHLAVVDLRASDAAVAHHVDLERRAQARLATSAPDDDSRIACRPAPAAGRCGAASAARQVLRQAVLRVVAHQPARVVHLVHHAVAHVDAGGAADALVLQALADVDAGGADLHAQAAVDAVAQAQRPSGRPSSSASRAARRARRRS